MTDAPSPALAELIRIAHEAGGLILKHYAESPTARAKPDLSPVTAADEEAEALILTRLAQCSPGVPVIAEESAARGQMPQIGESFILVDPLDGTREFLKRNGEFTVNIAAVTRGIPAAGVVYAPALSRLFAGDSGGAYEISAHADGTLDLRGARRICARKPPPEGLTAAISRSHGDTRTEEYLKAYRIAELVTAGSSLKFCLIAAGEADLYPRHGPTMEWDTAAGHAVVNAAGGSVTRLDGTPFLYGKVKEGFRNASFVARGLA